MSDLSPTKPSTFARADVQLLRDAANVFNPDVSDVHDRLEDLADRVELEIPAKAHPETNVSVDEMRARLESGTPSLAEPSTFEELIDELESATVKLTRGGPPNPWRENANRYDAARSALVSAYNELEAERVRWNDRIMQDTRDLEHHVAEVWRLRSRIAELEANALTVEEAEEALRMMPWASRKMPLVVKLRSISSRREEPT